MDNNSSVTTSRTSSLEDNFSSLIEKYSQMNSNDVISRGRREEEAYNQKVILQNMSYQNDMCMRMQYAKVFLWVCVGLCVVQVALIFLMGFNIVHYDLPVALELVPMTFVDVIGIIYIICHYLFPNHDVK